MSTPTAPVAKVLSIMPTLLIRVDCPFCDSRHEQRWVLGYSVPGPRVAKCRGWRSEPRRYYLLADPLARP